MISSTERVECSRSCVSVVELAVAKRACVYVAQNVYSCLNLPPVLKH